MAQIYKHALADSIINEIERLRHNPDCGNCEGCKHLTQVKIKIRKLLAKLIG